MPDREGQLTDMNNIEQTFRDLFAHWEIQLPANATVDKKRGEICQSCWSISYVFVEDYMDYYARHRMTSPWHGRIYADGKVAELPAPREWYAFSDETDEVRAREEFFHHNRAVYAELKRKGLVDTEDQS